MFYEPSERNHGLPRDPFKSLVIPRPIGWITTMGRDGVVNLAPYSYFNICSVDPPTVMFAPTTRPGSMAMKDTHRNIEHSGEFVVNIATYDLSEKMNLTSAEFDSGVSEVLVTGLTTAPSQLVSVPRLQQSPISMECLHLTTVTIPVRQESAQRNFIIIGEVVGVHISDDVLTDGFVDIEKLRPVAKLGYLDYAVIASRFTMPKPDLQTLVRSVVRGEGA